MHRSTSSARRCGTTRPTPTRSRSASAATRTRPVLSFYLDEDVPRPVAAGLRSRGVDAVSAYDLGLANRGVADPTHLANATDAGRVLVTFNRQDFQRWDERWRAEGRQHAGIVWCLEASVRRSDVGGLVRALAVLAGQHDTLAGVCMMLPRPSA